MNKVILITGISSGFGRDTAKLLADKGHTVYGTVRKESAKEKNINYLIMDLTDQQSIQRAVSNILEKEGDRWRSDDSTELLLRDLVQRETVGEQRCRVEAP